MPKEKGDERRKRDTVVTRMAQVSLPPISTIRKKERKGFLKHKPRELHSFLCNGPHWERESKIPSTFSQTS